MSKALAWLYIGARLGLNGVGIWHWFSDGHVRVPYVHVDGYPMYMLTGTRTLTHLHTFSTKLPQ